MLQLSRGTGFSNELLGIFCAEAAAAWWAEHVPRLADLRRRTGDAAKGDLAATVDYESLESDSTE